MTSELITRCNKAIDFVRRQTGSIVDLFPFHSIMNAVNKQTDLDDRLAFISLVLELENKGTFINGDTRLNLDILEAALTRSLEIDYSVEAGDCVSVQDALRITYKQVLDQVMNKLHIINYRKDIERSY